jgi:hypothetical protein
MSAPLPPPSGPPPSTVARAGSLVARILWTMIPFGTLGLCGWAPAVHIARRRRTAESWWWLAALVAGTIGEIVLVSVVPQGHGSGQFDAGLYVVSYLITASVYAWRGCGPERTVPPHLSAGYGAAWMAGQYGSATPASPTTFVAPATPFSFAPATPPMPPAASASDMAAEIQAELRELRGFLGGEDAR